MAIANLPRRGRSGSLAIGTSKKYVSPKSGRPLGRNERYRWNVMIDTKVHGRPLGDYIVSDLKKHHVEAFVDANHVERIATIVDARGHTYQAKRGGLVSTNRWLGRLKAFFNWAIDREYLTQSPAQRVHKRREFERERRLEPGEEERLRALTNDDWLWRLRIVAALETGCRIGEILNVQFKQLRWGSQRAAPLESDDEGTAYAVPAALAGAPGHAQTPAPRSRRRGVHA